MKLVLTHDGSKWRHYERERGLSRLGASDIGWLVMNDSLNRCETSFP